MSSSSGSSSLFRRFKYFDAYPKTLEDFRVKTFSGAAISITCTVIIVTLFLYEWKLYLTQDVQQELFVDITRGQKFHINLDIIFPNLPCQIISTDSMDISGEQQLDVVKGLQKIPVKYSHEHKMFKRKADNEEATESTTTTTTTTTASTGTNETALDKPKCGSCYGAENSRLPCCQTCDQVKQAYREKNWQFSPIGIEQCKDLIAKFKLEGMEIHQNKISEDEMNKLLKSGDGCQLIGYLEVNRVAGNFHIAPGSSYQENHAHIHDLRLSQVERFNTSHIINNFYFGEDIFPNQLNPLQNTEQIAFEKGSMAYNYFIKIVPTTYQFENGSILNNTYQYSVTKSNKQINLNVDNTKTLPGIFVSYELSPIMVKFIAKQKSLTHFITSCCAIIGGLFTIAGLIDSFIYKNYNLYKKHQLNKLT